MNSAELKEKFDLYLKEKSALYLSENNSLTESIKYSLMADGKRIRPLLCLGFAQGVSGNLNMAMSCGAAVEMIHTYSLIHDDLPAMDNDDFRRGRLSNHKVFGEAGAILAGDALLNLAPEFLIRELTLQAVDPVKTLELTTLLLKASGHEGMVKGQAMDMEYEKKNLETIDKDILKSALINMHKLKTGSIISWSCVAGLYTHSDLNLIRKYKCQVEALGQQIGLLFQIVDDVLDVTSEKEKLGKTPGKDQEKGKLTYTNLHGLKATSELGQSLVKNILDDLEKLHHFSGDWSVVRGIVRTLEKSLI